MNAWSIIKLDMSPAIEFTSQATAINLGSNQILILGGRNS